jgi:hypothetical protein
MTITNRLRKHAARAALAAGSIAIAAAGLATPTLAAPAGSHSPAAAAATARHLSLTPMPQGKLAVTQATASLAAYGFTPGSTHEVALSVAGREVPLGKLTANSGGSADWSYSLSDLAAAARQAGATAPGGSLLILNAGQGTPVIAQSPVITAVGSFPVRAVEPGHGVIKPGSATLVYNPATRRLSVTVNATGLTPGAHAAHIHVGSCRQQGGVAEMLMDFTASSHGVISNETRTITGISAARLSGGWYLNLHQGNSRNIESKGTPTINFRPLECGNI